MKKYFSLFLLFLLTAGCIEAQNNKNETKMKTLTAEEKRVIIDKGTERPFIGKYTSNKAAGTYICKQCGNPLYRSDDKFESGCGWPAFDDEIAGAITKIPDKDGVRTEIVCAKCGGHLGHVFTGEKFTDKDVRHCVNSISMDFIPDTKEALFAGGCFWGVEHLMEQQDGVLSVESGYMGGKMKNPTYKDVSTGKTGYAEVVRVIYDPSKVDYKTLAKLFFEIHDPTQTDGQGPDIGNQYRSEIFYKSPAEKEVVEDLIDQLKAKGYNVTTHVTPASDFYPAEEYHQDYYQKTGKQPYCHRYTKRF